MSFFGVTIEKIAALEPIAGADFIEKATLAGIDFSFVVKKGDFSVGGEVLYIPLDAIVPEDVLIALGLVGKLGGKAKNRVKTIKLKGVYSQGLAAPISLIKGCSDRTPEGITKFLGITKYDDDTTTPAEDADKPKKFWPWHRRWAYRLFGKKFVKWLYGRPSGSTFPLTELNIPVYDIESCNRYKGVVEWLMDTPVVIQLKVEGQNAACLYRNGKMYVNQRRFSIVKDTNNHLWKLAEGSAITDFTKALSAKLRSSDVLVYFEAAGSDNGAGAISGNIYEFKTYRAFIFDIKVNGAYMNKLDMLHEIEEFYGPVAAEVTAPVLCRGQTLREWLNGRTLEQAAEQKGVLRKVGSQLEEGIVITPTVETANPQLGRVILKYRSKAYLAKQGD